MQSESFHVFLEYRDLMLSMRYSGKAGSGGNISRVAMKLARTVMKLVFFEPAKPLAPPSTSSMLATRSVTAHTLAACSH